MLLMKRTFCISSLFLVSFFTVCVAFAQNQAGEQYPLSFYYHHDSTGSGTVAVTSPDGSTCDLSDVGPGDSQDCTFASDATVTLTATPNAVSQVVWGWDCDKGSGSSTNTCTVNMNDDRNISVRFDLKPTVPTTEQYTLSFDYHPYSTGSGKVEVTSPVGSTCDLSGVEPGDSEDCQFDSGTTVTLTATLAEGSQVEWDGDCDEGSGGRTNTCKVVMDNDRAIGIQFNDPNKKLLSFDYHPYSTGSGKVEVTSPVGGTCDLSGVGPGDVKNCKFASGTTVTLTATLAEGSQVEWDGDCDKGSGGRTNTCKVVMDNDRAIGIQFNDPNKKLLSFDYHPYSTGSGKVEVTSPVGGTCDLSGVGPGDVKNCKFASNATVTLTATPGADSQVEWGWDCKVDENNPDVCKVTMNDDRNVFVRFNLKPTVPTTEQYTLSFDYSSDSTGSGTVAVTSPDGSGCDLRGVKPGGSEKCKFASGTTVTLTATLAEGSQVEWDGCDEGSGSSTNACTVTMDENKEVTVRFDLIDPEPPEEYTLTLKRLTGNDSGTVKVEPTGSGDCDLSGVGPVGESKSCRFASVTEVMITAEPVSGDRVWWYGKCDPDSDGNRNTCTVTMNDDKEIGFSFVPMQHTLSFDYHSDSTGSGTVAVTSTDDSTCDLRSVGRGDRKNCKFDSDATVTLTATPNAGSQVVWRGDCEVDENNPDVCTVTMGSDKSVNVRFYDPDKKIKILSLEYRDSTGSGKVVVTSNGDSTCDLIGLNPGGRKDCTFDSGEKVTLTATPNTGHKVKWSVVCEVDENNPDVCKVTMNEDKRVNVRFYDPDKKLLSFYKHSGGTGSGTVAVTSTDDSTCDLRGVGQGDRKNCKFDSDATVTLTATPNAGSQVVWRGDCDEDSGGSANVCTVTMDENKGVNVQFDLKPTVPPEQYTLAFGHYPGTGSGTVEAMSSDDSACDLRGVKPSGSKDCQFDSDAKVILTATPNADHQVAWRGDCESGSGGSTNTCEVTMGSDKAVGVLFVNAAPGKQILLLDRFYDTGSGTVAVTSPVGSTCDLSDVEPGGFTECQFDYGAKVTLTATPDKGYPVVWRGDCESGSGGSTNTCKVTMNDFKAVNIRFSLEPTGQSPSFTFRVNDGPGNGEVRLTASDNQNCTLQEGQSLSGCGFSPFAHGTSVRITAKPVFGSQVVWTGACPGSATLPNECVVTTGTDVEAAATFNSDIPVITSTLIRDYLGARNTFLLDNQPDRNRRIDRLKRGANRSYGQSRGIISGYGVKLPTSLPFSMEISKNLLSFSSNLNVSALSKNSEDVYEGKFTPLSPASSQWNVWTEGKLSRFGGKSGRKGNFGVVYTGIDYLLDADSLFGVMVQYDWLTHKYGRNNSRIKGKGWMVGPYATLRFSEDYYFDIRASWGRSSNRISPSGSHKDSFDTSRWLVSAALIGDINYGQWTIRPGISIQYIEEKQSGYRDSLGFDIPSQKISKGDIRFGPRISYVYSLGDMGNAVPWIQFEGVYGLGKKSLFGSETLASESLGLTGRIEGGLDFNLASGISLAISGKYSGIGSDRKSHGGAIQLEYRF